MNRKLLGILMITPVFSPDVGGIQTHLDDLCKYLRKRGHRIFVITYQPLTTKTKAPRFERKQNLEIRRIGWLTTSLFPKKANALLEFVYVTPVLLIFSLFFLLRCKKRVDLIHAHGLHAAFVAAVLAKTFKKKTIVTIHGSRIFNLSKKVMFARLMKMILSSFDAILVIANVWKMESVKMGLDSRKIKVFTHWVLQTVFRPIDKVKCKKKLALNGKFVVLFVGRLIETKGPRLMIGAAKRLNKIEGLHFVLIGDGPLAYEVKSASVTSQNVTYAGRVDVKKLVLYYNAADVVVVPSLHDEPFARVILESLSCGTPVIASNRGGIPEALEDSVGILVEPEVDEIAHTIENLYRHPWKLANLKRNCRAYSEKRFSENNAKVVESAYRQ